MRPRAFVRPARGRPDVVAFAVDGDELERWSMIGGVEGVEHATVADPWEALWRATLDALDEGFAPGAIPAAPAPWPRVGPTEEEAALPPATRAGAAEARLVAAGHPYGLFLQRRGDAEVGRRVHRLLFGVQIGAVWEHGFVTAITVDARRGLDERLSFDHPACWYLDTLAVVASTVGFTDRRSSDDTELPPDAPLDLDGALARVQVPAALRPLAPRPDVAGVALFVRRPATPAAIPYAGEVVWDGVAHAPEDVAADVPDERYPDGPRDPWGLWSEPDEPDELPVLTLAEIWDGPAWDPDDFWGLGDRLWEIELEDPRGGLSPDDAFDALA